MRRTLPLGGGRRSFVRRTDLSVLRAGGATTRGSSSLRARSSCNMRGVSLTAEALDAYSPQRVLNCAGVSMANS